jgi:hypothetical protein
VVAVPLLAAEDGLLELHPVATQYAYPILSRPC